MSDTSARHRTASLSLLAPVGALAGVLAAFGFVAVVDPNEPGHYPVCPLLHHTGILCPGCGGLRAAHALAHGRLTTALGANVLVVAAVAVFAVLWTAWAVRAARAVRAVRAGPGSPGPAAPRRAPPLPAGLPAGPRARASGALWTVLGCAVVLFTVVRNLPSGSALAP